MQITINGKIQEFQEGSTLSGLLVELQLADHPVAVEVNRQLVSRKEHAEYQLNPGDQLEVVTLVGGG